MKTIIKSKSRVNERFQIKSASALISRVKFLISALILISLSARGQTHVHFSLPLFNANPSTNRIVEVQPLTPFKGNVTSYNTGTNSYFFLSNALAADYGVTIKQRGDASAIQFQITVLSTNLGVIGAYTNTSVSGVQTYPTSGKAAWSILASDSRYVPHGTAGVSVAAEGGATATTNGDLVTISVPSVSLDPLTNLETRPSTFTSDLSVGRFQNGNGNSGDLYVGDKIYMWNANDDAWVQTFSMGDYVLNINPTFGLSASRLVGLHYGDGSGLSNVVVAASLDPRFTSSSATITANSNTLAATTISASTVTATAINGGGSGLTLLNASQLASGTVPTARLDTQLQDFVSSDSVRAASGGLEVGGQTASDTINFTGPLRGKGTLLTNSFGVFLAPTNAGTVGQVPTLTADGVSMAFASVAGIGDLQAVNNLADVASTGQSRTNLGAHNADNLTRGTIALARLTSIPLSQVTNAGTAAYSNAAAFTLYPTNTGTDGQVVSLTGNKTKFIDASSGIQTLNGSGTNTSFYSTQINWGTNNTYGVGTSGNIMIEVSDYDSSIGNTTVASTLIGGGANRIWLNGNNNAMFGGFGNFIGAAQHVTVIGGLTNATSISVQDGSVIVGGIYNTMQNGGGGTIVGGYYNSAAGSANGGGILGGYSNYIGGSSSFAIGSSNRAEANNSFSLGKNAMAIHSGSFVWNSSNTAFSSSNTNQFLISSKNGVGINTNNPGTNALSVLGNVESSVGFTVNGVPVGGGTTYTNNTGLPGVVVGSGIGTNLSTLATTSGLAAGTVPVNEQALTGFLRFSSTNTAFLDGALISPTALSVVSNQIGYSSITLSGVGAVARGVNKTYYVTANPYVLTNGTTDGLWFQGFTGGAVVTNATYPDAGHDGLAAAAVFIAGDYPIPADSGDWVDNVSDLNFLTIHTVHVLSTRPDYIQFNGHFSGTHVGDGSALTGLPTPAGVITNNWQSGAGAINVTNTINVGGMSVKEGDIRFNFQSPYTNFFILNSNQFKFAGDGTFYGAYKFLWGASAQSYIDWGGDAGSYGFLMRTVNGIGMEIPTDLSAIRLTDDHRLDGMVKLAGQSIGGLVFSTNNFSGMLAFQSPKTNGTGQYVPGYAGIRAKDATGVEVMSINGEAMSQSELWLYTLIPPQLSNSLGGFRSVGDTNWCVIGVTNSIFVKGLTVVSNALSEWPATPRFRGDAMMVNSNGYPYMLLSTNGSGGSTTWTGTNKIGW